MRSIPERLYALEKADEYADKRLGRIETKLDRALFFMLTTLVSATFALVILILKHFFGMLKG